jgi:hypothetical protein
MGQSNSQLDSVLHSFPKHSLQVLSALQECFQTRASAYSLVNKGQGSIELDNRDFESENFEKV